MKTLLSTALALLALASVALTAGDQTQALKLQQAIDLIETAGDPDRATPLLEEAAEGPDRAVAARALFYLARLQERQNLDLARRTYERIVGDFAGVRDVAAEARERIAALRPQVSQNGSRATDGLSPAPRRVLDGEWTELHDMSADGRLVVGQRVVRIGVQELVARDLSTGETRTIGMRGGGPEISDDGTLVAHGSGPLGVLVTGSESDAPSVSLARQAGLSFRAHDWAPDGSAVLVSIERVNESARLDTLEFAWVSVADGSLRSIRSFERWAAPIVHATEPEVSPDGRFMAFVAPPAPESEDRYVYVMDADGQTIEPVVSASGQRGWPKWTPDGRHVLFTQEHASGAGLWSVPVENGRAAGQPRLLYGNIGSDSALLGITRDGVLHYRRNDVGRGRYAGIASHVVPRTLATAGPQEPPMTFRFCCSAWSPDGQRLAYWGDDGVVVRNLETREERSYELWGASVEGAPFWFHDGSAVIVLGMQGAYPGPADENLNYYRIDLETGAVRPVMNVGSLGSWSAALSNNDRTLYVARRDEAEGPFTRIVAVDLATAVESLVATLPAGITRVPGIALSPDGTTLAVGAPGNDYRSDGRIFTVSVEGTDFRDIGAGGLPGFWGAEFFRWAPDGRSLLFRSYDANEDWQIMRIPASGGAPEFDGVSYETLAPLVPDIRMVRGNFNGLDVSPDGSHLVVSTLVAPRFEVWALDLPSLAP